MTHQLWAGGVLRRIFGFSLEVKCHFLQFANQKPGTMVHISRPHLLKKNLEQNME